MNPGRLGRNTFVCSHPHPPSTQNKGAAMMIAVMLAHAKSLQPFENFTPSVYAVRLLASQSVWIAVALKTPPRNASAQTQFHR